jgi:hypothetical protein
MVAGYAILVGFVGVGLMPVLIYNDFRLRITVLYYKRSEATLNYSLFVIHYSLSRRLACAVLHSSFKTKNPVELPSFLVLV